MQKLIAFAGLVTAILALPAAPAAADPWTGIDLVTLPDLPDPSGRPGWYVASDLPAIAEVAEHPEYGKLFALIPQGKRDERKRYRPSYVRRLEDSCTLVETVILAGDYGELLARAARRPPPQPAGARHIWFAGPTPQVMQLAWLMHEMDGFDGMEEACPTIHRLFRTVDEEDNLVSTFLTGPGMPIHPIEKDVFLKQVPPAPSPEPVVHSGEVRPLADRLDVSGDVVAQFVKYAAALGIAEDEITASIFSGAFVPDLDDLRLVLLALGDVDCDAAFIRLIEDPYATLGQVENFDCAIGETARPGAHHEAWNARFGTPADEDVFVLTTRLYYVMTRQRPDPRWVNQPWPEGAASNEAQDLMAEVALWSAPYHFLWSDQGNPRRDLLSRYEGMRTAYLSDLPAQVSREQLASIGLVADTSAIDAAGSDWPGSILTLFLHGDWNRIDWIGRARFISANGGSVTNWKQLAIQNGGASGQSAFEDVAAQWALARYAVLGDCGDPVTTMIHTSTPVTDWYRGRNFEGREYGLTSQTEFTALAGFGNILVSAPATMRADIGRFEQIAEAMGCDSDIRRAMEGNMQAYFESREPLFRSGL